ncbi:transposase zinc-binding domain-containing protein, partial [Rubripirellula obstinata]|uniref:transposase zinc-binding domain-containing protein n=1 Tax=Rubripirellula obstinata TaxID=406547 RepID=UPI0021BCF1F3
MSSVALALRVHAPEYLERFGDRVPLGHRKVLGCITRCRTGELAVCSFSATPAAAIIGSAAVCGNRHCPNCQKNKTSDWLAKQTDRLLPVHHFLVTFTVPEELRSLLRSNQREGYAAIFACGSE